MKNKRQIKLQMMVAQFKKKFNEMWNSMGRTPETLKKMAWDCTEGAEDWKRRVVYGHLMEKYQTQAQKKQYAKKQEAQVIEAFEDMKEGASMMASGVFG